MVILIQHHMTLAFDTVNKITNKIVHPHSFNKVLISSPSFKFPRYPRKLVIWPV